MMKNFSKVMILSMFIFLIITGCGKRVFDGSSTGKNAKGSVSFKVAK
jgi:hypothetical protein